jgi:hypothetical protein
MDMRSISGAFLAPLALICSLLLETQAAPGVLSVGDYLDLYFPPLSPRDGRVTGEATPSYLYDAHVPAKLLVSPPPSPSTHSSKATFPHARLVVLLREPVTRAFSRVAHQVST